MKTILNLPLGILLSIYLLFGNTDSFAQTIIWSENFNSYSTPTGITGSGTVNVGDYPAGVSKWTLNVSSCSLTEANDYISVRSGIMESRDVDGPALWTSQSINISGHDNVKISIYLSETGTQESDDSIHVYYKIDAGSMVSLGAVYDDFNNTTLSIDKLSGTNLTLYVYCDNDDAAEYLRFDDISVTYIEKKDLFYYVSDADDNLYIINRLDGSCSLVGPNGVTDIESIANWPAKNNQVLYACNGGTFGTINTATGAFTAVQDVDIDGAAQGSEGSQNFTDIDGLTFDPRSGILWASHRRNGTYDLLFQINPATGKYIPDVFGVNIDYIVIAGSGVYIDFDDMAISPEDGTLYGVSNNGTSDQILTINKLTGAVSVVSSLLTATDVEGLGFSNDNHLYGTMGNSDDFIEIDWSTGSSTTINTNLCGTGDPECIAALVEDANLITGKIYEDIDLDAIDDGEAGIANVEILLYYDSNADGQLDGGDEYLTTTISDIDGNYFFDYAAIGDLLLIINESTLPAGYSMTSVNLQTASFTSQSNIDSLNDFGAASGSDCDANGIPDFTEGSSDTDNDGVTNDCDLDNDNDGILDSEDGIRDSDGDGILNMNDLDSDNDGIPDAIEANNGVSPSGYNSSIARITGSDTDGDGLLNSVDNDPNTAYTVSSISNLPIYDHDWDGVKDFLDKDSDNDGIQDVTEAGGTDSNKDGIIDGFTDSNSDGLKDGLTTSPLSVPNTDNAWETTNSMDLLPNYIDMDSDNDAIDDTREGYSTNQLNYPSIIIDSDGDGLLNLWDISNGGSSISPVDTDSDGTPDYLDSNSDDDEYSDAIEGNDIDNNDLRDVNPSNEDFNKNGIDDIYDNSCSGVTSFNIVATDYAEENNSSGYVNLTSSDLEFVNDGSVYQTIGLYFAGINLNQGQSITKAYIQFEVDEISTGSITITIKGEDIDNSSSFNSTAYNVSSRTKTTSSASWSPSNWNSVGAAGATQRTSEIRTIVQEIVDRAGWDNGYGMSFIFTGTNNSSVKRTATTDPVLHLEVSGILMYSCGTDIAVQDEDTDGEKDWRDVEGEPQNLPVILVEQKLSKIGNGNICYEWTTASEHNSSYFTVEESIDLKNFKFVGSINAQGESNSLKKYMVCDSKPENALLYYKLIQYDFDGNKKEFPILSIDNKAEELFKLYPNPATNEVFIESNCLQSIQILSLTGVILMDIIIENQIYKLNISSWPKGCYFIKITSNNYSKTEKLIIQN